MRGFRILLTFDHLLNVVTGGLPGQTLSGRAQTARNQGKRWGCVLCGILDWLERDHCRMALEGDILRARAVVTDSEDGRK